jgi:hypothetical protein
MIGERDVIPLFWTSGWDHDDAKRCLQSRGRRRPFCLFDDLRLTERHHAHTQMSELVLKAKIDSAGPIQGIAERQFDTRSPA